MEQPTIAISPVSHEYLTEGKEYKITLILGEDHNDGLGVFFEVMDDMGDYIHTLEHNSSHTNFKSWTLK